LINEKPFSFVPGVSHHAVAARECTATHTLLFKDDAQVVEPRHTAVGPRIRGLDPFLGFALQVALFAPGTQKKWDSETGEPFHYLPSDADPISASYGSTI
jgi:hypothetical protein